jgi:hypothetical protein
MTTISATIGVETTTTRDVFTKRMVALLKARTRAGT